MRRLFITIFCFCPAAAVIAQVVNDPFAASCQYASGIPAFTAGSEPFLQFIHSAAEISRFTVRYAFDGRPLDGDNSHMDIYLKPAVLQGSPLAPKRPVIFLLHGGEGRKGDQSMVKQAMNWSRRGYIAVVPDYRTGRDSAYGQANCRDSVQMALSIQYSVVDVRGAIRRFLGLAAINTQLAAVADTNNLFLSGYSWGSSVAYNLAVSESAEWLFGGAAMQNIVFYVDNNGTLVQSQLDFYQNLDDLDVGLPSASLNKQLIKGVACMALATINLEMVDVTDQIPLLFHHGTCDPVAPYNQVKSRQLLINSISANLASQGLPVPSDTNSPEFPCNEPEFMYTIYGSQAILDYVRFALPPLGEIPFMTRIFRLCGGQHSIESDAAEFERVMFFYDIIHGDLSRSEDITLDHALTLPPGFNPAGTKEYYNCVYQLQSGTWPQNNQYCKTCAGYQTKPNAQSRCPYLDVLQSPSSPDRYKAKPAAYCVNLGSSQGLTATTALLYYDTPQVLEVYDLGGRLITKDTVVGNFEESVQICLRKSGLHPGVYILRCGGLSYKMGIFY